MRLIKPAWFKQVEDVIGYEKALIELSKVFKSDIKEIYWEKSYCISSLFSWYASPQKGEYWGAINRKSKLSDSSTIIEKFYDKT